MKTILILTIILGLQSCSKKEKPLEFVELNISTPSFLNSMAIKTKKPVHRRLTSAVEPVEVSDINCVGVMVGFINQPIGPGLNKGFCTKSGGERYIVGQVAGLVPFDGSVGGNISVPNVLLENPLHIALIGFRIPNGESCALIDNNFDPDNLNYSEAYIIAERVGTIITKATNSIELLAKAPKNTTTETIDGCDDSIIDDNNTISGSSLGKFGTTFGNGGDGDVTLNEAVATNSININTAQISSNGGSRIFGASKKITNVSTDGLTLTLTPAIVPGEFNTGEEIFWVVTGEKGSTGCGVSGVDTGAFGVTKIDSVSTSNSTIVLRQKIMEDSNNFSELNANLGNSTSSSSTDFCSISLVRVANFRNLTISSASGTDFTMSADHFDFDTGMGGIIAFKVQNNLTLNKSLIIEASHLGYSSGNQSLKVGNGNLGQNVAGTNSMAGKEGDLAGVTAGGGASSVGNGGDGASHTGSGGTKLNSISENCNNTATNTTTCFAFGGGAGNESVTSPTFGGGIIFIQARNVFHSNTSSLTMNAVGEDSPSFSGGNGGGTIHGDFLNIDTTINADASGGDGDGSFLTLPSAGTGGGAGGYININYCLQGPSGSVSPISNAGLGSTINASDGDPGVTNQNQSTNFNFCL